MGKLVDALPAAQLPLLATDSILVSRDDVVVGRGQVQDILDLIPDPEPSYSFSGEEIPSGVKDGNNKVFTLANTPTPGSLQLFYNGSTLTILGADYALAGNQITLAAYAPDGTDDVFVAMYQY